jgi:phage shock protein PspC (stress-responsive transcriptional regulator)
MFEVYLQVLFTSFLSFLPKIVSALIILLIGWFLGYFIGSLIKKILEKVKLDEHLVKRKSSISISGIISTIIKWSIYLAFIWVAVDVVEISALSELMRSIVLEFLPGIIWGIVILIAGYAIADYIRVSIERSKIFYSDLISKIVFWLIIYISLGLALPKFGIDPTLVNNILLILIACIGVGIAIALGLGLKDVIREEAKKYLKKIKR